MRKRPSAVFLDRDGTLLNERGYLSDPKKIHFYPGIFGALKRIQKGGFKLIVLTNQSGVARGFFTLNKLKAINRTFLRILRKKGVKITGIYYCPHRPEAGCSCRKPKPGMARQAARDHHLNLKGSFVIGDQDRDIQLAKNIKAKGILVLTGAGRSARRKVGSKASKVAANLNSAARWIENEKNRNL